jgi:U6 snRNA-associated Sm-like protein LSm7
MDFEKLLEKKVRVKFIGGREVVGVLKGYDQLVNIVLDDCIEYIRSEEDPEIITSNSRYIGKVVCRGSNILVLVPDDTMIEIANPFITAEEEIVEEPAAE